MWKKTFKTFHQLSYFVGHLVHPENYKDYSVNDKPLKYI